MDVQRRKEHLDLQRWPLWEHSKATWMGDIEQCGYSIQWMTRGNKLAGMNASVQAVKRM
jgi:hypothetical protein